MTEQEIIDEALVTPRGAFLPLPDLRVVAREGFFQIITPSFTSGGFNEVAFAALADDEADAVIDDVLAEYRALGIRFRWVVPPGSTPADLGERLAKRGLERHAVWAMAKPIAATTFVGDRAVTVELVDERTIDTFTEIMAAGWSSDPAPLRDAHRIALASGRRMFLARVDGEPAATAGYVPFPRSAYLFGGVTLPAFRRRGCYRALVEARLADALARGIELATSHARATTSGPLLERHGFGVVARFETFTG